MTQKINRRTFIKQTGAIGASAMIGGQFALDLIGRGVNAAVPSSPADIAAITGADYFANTVKAVEMVGGMGNFVSKGSVVGLNINAVRDRRGTDVNPDIVLAVMNMCYEAGAKEIIIFKKLPDRFWKNSDFSKDYNDQIKSLRFSDWNTKKVQLPRARLLKEAHVISDMFDCDVYINMPIIKHHEGTLLTGVLKNFMGATPHNPTNRHCHTGPGSKGDGFYEDIPYLSQCIADLNLIRRPDLCISDGTEFITTNGPFGPGELKQLDTIVAGTDPVAMDSYCAGFLGLDGKKMATVVKAAEHGIGIADFDKLNIKEING